MVYRGSTSGDYSSRTEVKVIVDHILPLLALVGDWCLNGISAERQHLFLNFIPIAVYLLVAAIISMPLTFMESGVLGIVVVGALLLWFVLCWGTNKKLKLLLARK